MENTKIVIIGAGIAGLTAAIYLKRANVDFVILESKSVGGKLNMIHELENYPGLDHGTGQELLNSLKSQTADLGISIIHGSVQTILKDKVGFKVISDSFAYLTKAVIVASGISPKSNFIENEKKYIGRGVSYCATCDGNFFKGQNVAIYGNNDVAIEDALYLSNIVKKVYLICKEDSLNGDRELIKQVMIKTNIEVITKTTIKEIVGDDFGVTGINFLNGKSLKIDGIFPLVGDKTSADMLNNLKPSMNNGFIVTNENMETDIIGLYAIGDIRQKQLRQLVTSASDGAIAATLVSKFVNK